MPKVLEDLQLNLFVYIYTNDHVHVFKGRKADNNQKEAKINIGSELKRPSLVSASEDMKNKDIRYSECAKANSSEPRNVVK